MSMLNSATVTVTLPGGFWLDGRRYQEAELCPLTGRDEAFLLEECESLLPAQWTTALLSRCVTRLGPWSAVTAETVRSLAVGDREALTLHLRRLTLGSRLQCVLKCPLAACNEPLDLELNVGEFLLPPYQDPKPFYEVTIPGNGAAYKVRFRLPTGADQEAAAALARQDPAAGADLVLRRCLELVLREDDEPAEALPAAVMAEISRMMAELDPQAELTLNMTCPVCGHAFSTIFDPASYFSQELASRVKHLYREVHQLAFHYHWGEAEIMGMTARKRQRYLDLLAEVLPMERAR
jgi:hypothetical protein